MPVRDKVTAMINEKSTGAPSPAGTKASERHGLLSTAYHSRCHSGSRQGSAPAAGTMAFRLGGWDSILVLLK